MTPSTLTGIPLTVVGGFLGAGTTTLLNRLLQGSDRRIAVLVNDLGTINDGSHLVRSRDDETIGLIDGCAGCGSSVGAGASSAASGGATSHPARTSC